MSTLLNKSYLVKVSTKGGGGSKIPQILSTWFVHSPLQVFMLVLLRMDSGLLVIISGALILHICQNSTHLPLLKVHFLQKGKTL